MNGNLEFIYDLIQLFMTFYFDLVYKSENKYFIYNIFYCFTI